MKITIFYIYLNTLFSKAMDSQGERTGHNGDSDLLQMKAVSDENKLAFLV